LIKRLPNCGRLPGYILPRCNVTAKVTFYLDALRRNDLPAFGVKRKDIRS